MGPSHLHRAFTLTELLSGVLYLFIVVSDLNWAYGTAHTKVSFWGIGEWCAPTQCNVTSVCLPSFFGFPNQLF
jgi:hypothetical protein